MRQILGPRNLQKSEKGREKRRWKRKGNPWGEGRENLVGLGGKKKKTRKREKATLALNVDLIDGPLELQLGAVRELSSND